MTLEELVRLVHIDLPKLETPNTIEYASKYRKATKAAYELDSLSELVGLEATWKLIEHENPMLGEDREKDDFDSPLDSFRRNVDMGFYPPPEIMLSILRCFDLYFAYGGHKSLDEIFFGEPHKKKSGAAFSEAQWLKYTTFQILYASGHESLDSVVLPGKSLVEKADLFLRLHKLDRSEVDPESFLKGYRRWLKKIGNK